MSAVASHRTGFTRAIGGLCAVLAVVAGLAATAGAAAALATDRLVLVNVDDPIVRGAADSFTVQVVTGGGTLDASYRGRVTFTATDPAAQLPPDYTFTAADAGQHTFSMNWVHAGSQSLTVSDVASTADPDTRSSITVTQAVSLVLYSLADPVARGLSTGVGVEAVDYRGIADPRYSGAIHFTSSDPSATLPPDYSFTAGDGGSHYFYYQLKWHTPGLQSLTATDTVNAGFKATYTSIEVTQATVLKFQSITDPVVRGVPNSFSVLAQDAYGNSDPLYTGTVHFTATDPSATVPADYTFTATDAGNHYFSNGLTWATPGTRKFTVTDTVTSSLTATRSGIQVTATAGLRMSSVADPIIRGSATGVYVTAVDSLGNVDASYRGTVHFTSTDPAATLPADYTFTAGDGGQHYFYYLLKWVTPGDQTLTVTDSANGFSAQRLGITVTQATTLHLGGISDPIGVNAVNSFYVQPEDSFGTVDPLYRGTVKFTSNDPAASLPANYTYVATDSGTHYFSLSWATPGSRKLTVKDLAASGPSGSKSGIQVTKTAAIRLVNVADPIARGQATSFYVQAFDANGVVDAGYRGTVHFTSDDPAAVLPADYTFTAGDAGSHSFYPYHWFTPGDHKLTVTDTSVATLTNAHTGITVTQSVGLNMTGLQDPIPQLASNGFYVRAQDQFGNNDPLYTGTITFSSDDPAAILPANYTFVAADAGQHSFTVVWKTAGDHKLTVKDTVQATFKASKPGITVTALVSLRMEGLDEPIMHGASDSFTVRAVDAFGRTATAFTDKVHFTSDDPAATLPADYTFTAGDGGYHTFVLKWGTAGARSITVTDTTTPSLTGTVTGITVTQATTFAIVAISDPVAHGTATTFTLKAVDQYGTIDPLYTGKVQFTSTDPIANLPSNYKFVAADNGQHGFTLTWKTVGEQSLTATDVNDATITATITAITVT